MENFIEDGKVSRFHLLMRAAGEHWRRLGIADSIQDFGNYPAHGGDDYTVSMVLRVPGRFRILMRRLGLDRSTWKVKRTEHHFFKGIGDE